MWGTLKMLIWSRIFTSIQTIDHRDGVFLSVHKSLSPGVLVGKTGRILYGGLEPMLNLTVILIGREPDRAKLCRSRSMFTGLFLIYVCLEIFNL